MEVGGHRVAWSILPAWGAGDSSSNLDGPSGELMLTRYERTRLMSARALQIAQGAPPLVRSGSKDNLKIAVEELEKGKIPLVIV